MFSFVQAPPSSDAQLAARIAAGDRAALGQLYQREAARVYRYALAMCSNDGVAADVTQETFIAFANKPQGYDAARGPLQGYLMGVARHHVLAQLRERFEPLEDIGDEPAGDGDPDALLVQQRDHAALLAAIARLPVAFREVVVLVELQEMSYADAAKLAGIELNTLRTRLHRAKHKLAELLRARAAI